MAPRGRSLRSKIALRLIVVVVLFQITLAVTWFRRGVIEREVDGSLEESAEAMVENLIIHGAPWTAESVQDLVPAGSEFVLYAIRDAHGEVLVPWNVPAEDALPFTPWETIPSGPVGTVFTHIGPTVGESLTGDRSPLRLTTVPFRYEGEPYFFQAAVRDRLIDRLSGPFLNVVVLGVPVGIAVALLAGWLIAGRVVRPIRALSRAASEVGTESLGERFEVGESDLEIARLESELNSALTRIEAAYRAQAEFLSNVSHELKTPISVLVTQAEVAQIGERTTDKGYAFVATAEREMKRLGRLVESILILARGEILHERTLDAVPVNDVVLQAVQHCQELARGSGVRLIPNLIEARGNDEPTVLGDAGLLQAMLENLLRNAIAHSPAEGSVEVDASASDGAVEVAVRDRGPGLPQEYLHRVFDRFVQAPTGRRGTGLGLSIAGSVVRLHRGHLEARNREGGGCVFVVVLPLERTVDRG